MAIRDIVIISDNPRPNEDGGVHFTMDPGELPRLPVIGDGIVTVDETGTSRLYTVTEVQFAVRPGKLGERAGELTDLHVRVDLVSTMNGAGAAGDVGLRLV